MKKTLYSLLTALLFVGAFSFTNAQTFNPCGVSLIYPTEVATCQTFLEQRNFLNIPAQDKGILGPRTREAIQRYNASLTSNPTTTNTTSDREGYRIHSISGQQSNYRGGAKIKIDVKGHDEEGNVATARDGYHVQAYIYPASDTGFLNYLPPNPSHSYNGKFKTGKKAWRVQMKTPTAPGSYILRIAFYCSKEGSKCYREGGHGEESIRVIPFTVGSPTATTQTTATLPNATVGVSYSTSNSGVVFNPTTSRYSLSISSGNLPPGLSLTREGRCTLADCRISLPISGIPTRAEEYTFKVKLTHGDRENEFGPYSIRVNPAQIETTSSGCPTGAVFSSTTGARCPTTTTTATTPYITGSTPNSGPIGTEITINGSGFTASDQIIFGNLTLSSQYISSGQLRFTVPSNVTVGTEYKFYVKNSAGSSYYRPFTVTSPVVSAPAVGSIQTSLKSKSAVMVSNVSDISEDDEGRFIIEFEVTAVGGNLTIESYTQRNLGLSSFGNGVHYMIEDSAGNRVTTGQAAATLARSGGGTSDGPVIRLLEGQSTTLHLTVDYDPTVAGFYRLQLNTIAVNAPQGLVLHHVSPLSDYETSSVYVGNSTAPTTSTVQAAPTISGSSPTSGPVGTVVDVTGAGFTRYDEILFGNLTLTGNYISDTQFRFSVPQEAIVGTEYKFHVKNAGGSSYYRPFTVTASGATSRNLREEVNTLRSQLSNILEAYQQLLLKKSNR